MGVLLIRRLDICGSSPESFYGGKGLVGNRALHFSLDVSVNIMIRYSLKWEEVRRPRMMAHLCFFVMFLGNRKGLRWVIFFVC